jgi:hypothetical protein
MPVLLHWNESSKHEMQYSTFLCVSFPTSI